MLKYYSLVVVFLTTLVSVSVFGQLTATCKLFFEVNKHSLDNEESVKLKNFLKSLDTVIPSRFEITGYCDDIGSNGYNDTLSANRAIKVKNAILESGVKPELIKIMEGKGELPTAVKRAEIEHHRAFNRRVEVAVVYSVKEKRTVAVANKLQPVTKKLKDLMNVGDKVTLENILFEGGRSELLPESFPALDSLVIFMTKNKKYHIMIYGHICCTPAGQEGMDNGTGIMNLSFARARAIYHLLLQYHVKADRMEYKGMKGDYPTGKGPKYDRRVEIEITKIDP